MSETLSAAQRQPTTPAARLRPYALAVLSGVLVFLAYPNFDYWPLAFVACVPLLIAISRVGNGQAFRLGLLTGLVANLGGFYWVNNLLRDFGDMPIYAALPLYFALCLQQGLVFGVAALFSRKLKDALPGGAALLWMVAIVAAEWCVPMIFKWYFGNSQYLHITISQLAELGGPLLVTAILGLVNGAVAELAMAAPGNSTRGLALRRAGLVLAVFAAAQAFGIVRIKQVDTAAAAVPSLRIGIVEANLGIFEKAAEGRLDSNLVAHQQLSVRAVAEGAELVVWPETAYEATTFFHTTDQHATREQAAGAARSSARLYRDVTWLPSSDASVPELEGDYGNDRDLGVPQRGFRAALLTGVVMFRGLTPEERASWPPFSERPRSIAIYNSAMLLNPDGRVLGVVDKNQRMPFSEAVPGGRFLYEKTGINLYRMLPMAGDMVRGEITDPPVLPDPRQRGEWKIGVMNCYEDISTSYSRAIGRYRPHVLINVTNDAWFGKTAEPYLHLALSTFRAIEQRTSLVRATNTGVSAFIDPVGRITAQTSLSGAEYLVREVPMLEASNTLFQRVGPWPGWLAFTVVAIGWLRVRKRR